MALLLPGESQRPRIVEVVLAAVVVLGLCSLGCSTATSTRRVPASIFRSARFESHAAHRAARHARADESAALVERTLHEEGLRFGTDGSVRALFGYVRTAHELVSPSEARPGDVVFFDMHGTGPEPDCADHAGLVESVDDGRIGFVEARDGQVRHSFVDPARPTTRRGAHDEIRNSFLRPKLVNDPPEARYFAGEMLCAVGRVRAD